MSPCDTFEETLLVPGCEVLIRAPRGVNVIGVVAMVDEEAQSVTFADGRVYQFPAVAAEEVDQ